MEAFLGPWNLQLDRKEGPWTECIKGLGIPAEFVDLYVKAKYLLTIEKLDNNKYQYNYLMDGSTEMYNIGPFKLGEQFEFYDPYCKRREKITISTGDGCINEASVIKEDPSIRWTQSRRLQGGEMVVEISYKDMKCKDVCLKASKPSKARGHRM